MGEPDTRKLTIVSFCLTLAVSCLLLVVPVYSGQMSMSSTIGMVTTNTRATLLEVNGWWSLIPLTIPVLTTLVVMIFPTRWVRIAATGVLALFVFIAGFSIGLFYLPSAVTLFAATLVNSETRGV